MSRWTAIVPIKPARERKQRLIGLDARERLRLTDYMLDHVLVTARDHALVDTVLLVSDAPHDGVDWLADAGSGLNGELTAARAMRAERDCLILLADLPLICPDDLSALLETAERYGAALAPDRHGTGTNALALKAGVPFTFAFGPESCGRHAAMVPPLAIVTRQGLAFDIDTPDDLHWARDRDIDHGWRYIVPRMG